MTIPYGYCHCECGNLAPIALRTDNKFGWVKGQPKKFIFGHKFAPRAEANGASGFKIDGIYCRLIALTQGMFAIVDADDYESLNESKWHTRYKKSSHTWYAERSLPMIDGHRPQKIGMHQQILGLQGTALMPDHRNLCGIDNRRKNLRPANKVQNGQNCRNRASNTSGYKGVYEQAGTGKWIAQIRTNGKGRYLGTFLTKIEAYRAYCAAAKLYHGEFARVA